MKRKEFIEQVEKLGFNVRAIDLNSCKKRKKLLVTGAKGFQMGWVVESKPYSFRMEDGNKMLAQLMVEYAGTPLEEREEEKRYVVKVKNVPGPSGARDLFVSTLKLSGEGDNRAFCTYYQDAYSFNTIEKAQALALLADGEVEEL